MRQINMKRFVPFNKNNNKILGEETVDQAWKLGALRVMMDIAQDANDDSMLSDRRELVSLLDIVLTAKDSNSRSEE